MEYIIDQAVQNYLSQLDESREEFVKDVEELQEDDLSTEEILAILATFTIADYWIRDLQMQSAIQSYLNATGLILDDMFAFGTITETQLLALRKMQESAIINYSQRLGDEVRLGISEGLSRGLKGSALRDGVKSKLSLNPGRIEGVVATTLATYRRSIDSIMSESLPAKTKFYYHGPLDEKTRSICRLMLSAGGMTRKDVESRFPGALIDGGGINCRHRWEPRTSDGKTRKAAMDEVMSNPKKYRKAKTLLEYVRANP